MYEKVINIVNKRVDGLQFSNLNINTSFDNLGVDSLQLITILVTVEEAYNIEFPDEIVAFSGDKSLHFFLELANSMVVEKTK